MPFLDGYEATKQIRELYSSYNIDRAQQPMIVAVTGHTEDEYLKKALDSGMDRVYPKPISVEEFGDLLIELGYIKQMPSGLQQENHEV